MAAPDMRLRLVVRRNRLPEARLMWNVRLESNPTIARLLEQLNDDVPLESDDWGLEDYVVELHDNDGTEFECLHYQLVRSVLKPDDRVYIRPLEQDDHRRRRISGRDQISSAGRHLIDGLPFGRPRLRASTDRPPVHIPPRKRARLTNAQPDDSPEEDPETGGGTSVLMLTNGETPVDGRPSSHLPTLLDDSDADSDLDDDDFVDTGDQSSLSGDSVDEEDSEDEGMEDDANPCMQGENEVDDELVPSAPNEQGLAEEARDLAMENSTLYKNDATNDGTVGSTGTAKAGTLKTAFPAAPTETCEEVLKASHGDLKTAYNVLVECFAPRLSREEVLASVHRGRARRPQHILGSQVPSHKPLSPPTRRQENGEGPSPAEGLQGDGDESQEGDDGLVRKYDHAGFPPGTITSGKGLAHMAAVSTSFGSSSKDSLATENTSTTLKAARGESSEDDDYTSSSGSSDTSDTSSDESDDMSDESSRDELSSDQSGSSDSQSDDSSDSSDETDAHSADRSPSHTRGIGGNGSDSTSSGDSDSDSGPEEQPTNVDGKHAALHTKGARHSSASSHSSSDTESTDTDSSSDSDVEGGDEADVRRTKALDTTVPKSHGPQSQLSVTRFEKKAVAIPVRPGAGKESTKRRNARRRAAKMAKRQAEKGGAGAGNPANIEVGITSAENERGADQAMLLFEAKRKALLEAIATGGIEVSRSGETALERDFTTVGGAKRKRTEEADAGPEGNRATDETEVTEELQPEDPSTLGSEKRRRIDLGAGRRMVLSALGLRNPKNKDEEGKLRDKLQSSIRQAMPLAVPVQSGSTDEAQNKPAGLLESVTVTGDDEDADDWKRKLNYRAVECCHEGIELTPAPFPFLQRWDPQQRSFKQNKRGGQSKRKDRNQSHFYQNDGGGRKKKRHESGGGIGHGYDEYGHETTDMDVTLNYDDTEDLEHQDGGSGGSGGNNNPLNEASQTTDLDDLPSLPTDVSALPVLHPGQAQAGMVIAWQKWSCSSATNWQPQLSRVTAIVVRVDEDAALLEVCLAKRDRYLDGNAKRYDDRTGQRIYKFEAPDLDEEEDDEDGVDEGFRTVSWAEMQDPKILQQPLEPTNQLDVDTPEVDGARPDSADAGGEKRTEEPESVIPETLPDPLRESLDKSDGSVGARQVDITSDPPANVASKTSCQAAIGQQATDMSMSDVSQISSPSRQLHETTSQAVSVDFPAHSETCGSGRAERSSQITSSSVPMPSAEITLPHLPDFESDAITGTPQAVQRLPVILSSSSIQSGRQPDFSVDEDGDDEDHVSELINPIDNEDYRDLETSPLPTDHSLTHTGQHRPITPTRGGETGDRADSGINVEPLSAASHISKSSLSSLNTIFCSARSMQTPSKPQLFSPASGHRTPKASAKVKEEMSSCFQQLPSLRVAPQEKLSLLCRTEDTISPPPPRRRSSSRKDQKQKQPFEIPAGSQVVDLVSSDPDEPLYTENYADDDVDGTYSPDRRSMNNSFPSGEGWVKKKKKGSDGNRRNTRG